VDVTFEQFAVARLPSLLRYAVVLTGDPDLAQDVVQKVMARTRARWRRLSEPETEVRRMVLTEYLSWRRFRSARALRVAARRQAGTDDFRGGPAPESAGPATVWGRVATLGRKHRAVLVLRHYEHLDDRAIADLIGWPPATVRNQASKALESLRLSSERQLIHAEETS
jgi:DNA-directed RNA polymerase specialized sigma24 family protein